MGETILPPVLLENQSKSIGYLFNDIGFIQFFHRILASATLAIILFTSIYLFKVTPNKVIKRLSKILFLVVIFQYLLGIIILKLYFTEIIRSKFRHFIICKLYNIILLIL